MNDAQGQLSPLGQKKREEILALATAAADGRRRKRQVARIAIVCVAAGLLVLPVLFAHKTPSPTVATGIRNLPAPRPPMPGGRLIKVEQIPTDPAIVERLSIKERPTAVVIIHDDELLEGLAQAHQPAGLAYVNGKATLLFR